MQTQGETIGQAIREERESRDWSQEHLARLLDVSVNTVRNWESGRSEGPRHGELLRLCDAFDWLLPWAPDDSRESSTARYLSPADWAMPSPADDLALAPA